jgi:hypothetical protein
VPDDQDGPVEVLYICHGANINVDDDGMPTSIQDAQGTLETYRALCAQAGLAAPDVIGAPAG